MINKEKSVCPPVGKWSDCLECSETSVFCKGNIDDVDECLQNDCDKNAVCTDRFMVFDIL